MANSPRQGQGMKSMDELIAKSKKEPLNLRVLDPVFWVAGPHHEMHSPELKN